MDDKDTGTESNKLSASGAVFGLLAWLTCRETVATFSSSHDAAIAAEMAEVFCKANSLSMPADHWEWSLKHPSFAKESLPNVTTARRALKAAFEAAPDLMRGYIDNIAMVLHDNGITDYETRNKIANAVFTMLFL